MQLLLIVFVLLGSQSSAAEMPGSATTIEGKARVRSEVLDRTDPSDGVRAFSSIRLRPSVTFRASERARIVFEPQFARYFGEQTWAGSGPAVNIGQQASGGLISPALQVYQGFGEYRCDERFRLAAGRMKLSYGDELVVGAVDWNLHGRAFDGFKASGETILGRTDLFAMKLSDSDIRSAGQGDRDFFGIYQAFVVAGGAELDLYVFHLLDGRGTGPAVTRLWTFGTRASGQAVRAPWGGVDYRGEGTVQTGSGFQADVELGARANSLASGRLSLGAFHASRNYNQLFPTTHKWLGFADVFGRRNIWGPRAQASLEPAARWRASLEGFRFYRVDAGASAYKLDGASALGRGGASGSLDLGMELDLTLKYEASERVSLFGGGSVLWPGEYLSSQFGGMEILFYYAQAEVSF